VRKEFFMSWIFSKGNLSILRRSLVLRKQFAGGSKENIGLPDLNIDKVLMKRVLSKVEFS
jgi:hypothetical protein